MSADIARWGFTALGLEKPWPRFWWVFLSSNLIMFSYKPYPFFLNNEVNNDSTFEWWMPGLALAILSGFL